MNCPTCNAPDSRVLEARIRADEAVRRRRECQACGNRWSTLERSYQRLPHPAKGKTVGPGSTKKSKLSDEQVLAIYHADLKRTTIGQLAQRFGVSKHTVHLIRAGKLHKKVIERSGLQLCTGCAHWRSAYCSMGFPDPELEGPAFAKDCNLYEASTQSISLDCPTSVQ